jgi:hypothetical protein
MNEKLYLKKIRTYKQSLSKLCLSNSNVESIIDNKQNLEEQGAWCNGKASKLEPHTTIVLQDMKKDVQVQKQFKR